MQQNFRALYRARPLALLRLLRVRVDGFIVLKNGPRRAGKSFALSFLGRLFARGEAKVSLPSGVRLFWLGASPALLDVRLVDVRALLGEVIKSKVVQRLKTPAPLFA